MKDLTQQIMLTVETDTLLGITRHQVFVLIDPETSHLGERTHDTGLSFKAESDECVSKCCVIKSTKVVLTSHTLRV